MQETKSEKFQTRDGEAEIELNQLGGIESGKLIVRLGKQHAGVVGKLTAAAKDPTLVAEAIAALGAGLDESEFESLLLKLTRGGRARVGDGYTDLDKKTIDHLFTGYPGELFKLVWFALRLNYADFFRDLAALVPSKPAMKTVIPSKVIGSP